MSAYMCEDRHFNFLICAAMQLARGSAFHFYHNGSSFDVTHDNATERLRMLARENAASLEHRYPGDKDMVGDDPDLIDYRDSFAYHCQPVDILSAIACYEYQACEHPGWATSMAHSFCRSLESAAIRALPGWDKASWGAPKNYLQPSKDAESGAPEAVR